MSSPPIEHVDSKEVPRNHPVFQIRKVEVSFEGEYYVLKCPTHGELMEAIEEGKHWSKQI